MFVGYWLNSTKFVADPGVPGTRGPVMGRENVRIPEDLQRSLSIDSTMTVSIHIYI